VRFENVNFSGTDPSLLVRGKLVLEKLPVTELFGESEERRKEDHCV